ncbi:DUF2103 domain-containing protein [Candidatus Synechococcus calcipolaris G9]|uniref:DUF2103 domain-containing protein n=1 Tax=Candidatus Synechococcus calcipolaris G9 TaxID=1497997 RepID=A0ABT6F0T3_9SYNE|nr:DUF2103 domain-containing protein [Candidatus Synechococcus calcipolaris]MDG2991430.1 DUF2103 domain-containing protein [Candidatus Synechococcus calcipolaris G9]
MGKSARKAGDSDRGRVVLNHSTHIPGLIPVLERIAQADGITTVIPGVIAPVKGRSPHLQLRVSVPIKGGFKVIARRGKTVQEVFILTALSQSALECICQQYL